MCKSSPCTALLTPQDTKGHAVWVRCVSDARVDVDTVRALRIRGGSNVLQLTAARHCSSGGQVIVPKWVAEEMGCRHGPMAVDVKGSP